MLLFVIPGKESKRRGGREREGRGGEGEQLLIINWLLTGGGGTGGKLGTGGRGFLN